MTKINEDTVVVFRANADWRHFSPEKWYDTFGYYLIGESGDKYVIQCVEYDWLDDDDLVVVERVLANVDGIILDEACELVTKARELRQVADDVNALCEAAVMAYHLGDLETCKAALIEARRRELMYGDDEASHYLAGQLLEIVDEVDKDAASD